MNERVLLVDADIVAFRAAAAAEKRTVIVKHLKTGKEKEFTNLTAFRDVLKEKYGDSWKSYETRYSFENVQTAESLGMVLNNIKARLHIFQKELAPQRIVTVLGGDKNFRDNLPLPSKYKGSRVDFLRPIHLEEAKKYLKRNLKSIVSDGIEADDVLNILAYQELSKGNEAIICSQDKDTFQSDGVKVYNWTVDKPEIVEVPLIGDIWIAEDGLTIKGLGFKFFAYQLLAGDKADDYNPFEVSTVLKRYGSKSVYKDLKDMQTGRQIAQKVVEVYKKGYPDKVQYTTWDGKQVETDWEGMLDLYFKCAYMLRSFDDKTTWREYFIERGWRET